MKISWHWLASDNALSTWSPWSSLRTRLELDLELNYLGNVHRAPISITFPWCGLGKPGAGPVPYSPETLSDSRGLHFPQVRPVMGRGSCHRSSACCVHTPTSRPFYGGTGPCYLGSKALNQWGREHGGRIKWQNPVPERILGSVPSWGIVQDCKSVLMAKATESKPSVFMMKSYMKGH